MKEVSNRSLYRVTTISNEGYSVSLYFLAYCLRNVLEILSKIFLSYKLSRDDDCYSIVYTNRYVRKIIYLKVSTEHHFYKMICKQHVGYFYKTKYD